MPSPNYFFSSDPHFDHANIIKFCDRPFNNVDEMNEALIQNHNAVVKPGDYYYNLGDFCFSYDPKRIAHFWSRLNGQKIWITGNHDPAMKDIGYEIRQHLAAVHYRYLELNGKLFGKFAPTLSHFPGLSWNKSHFGAFNLHGHHHGKVVTPDVRRLDVGVDPQNFVPISWDDVVKKLGSIEIPELPKRKE